jgi:chemotaxis protein methyltransferase CheR
MILAEERAKLTGWTVDLVATDLSAEILVRAGSATYSQFEVDRGMAPEMLAKYFRQDGENWSLKPEIRAMVRFARFNLLDDPAPLGAFDVVFCRNVLIYFDQDTKRQVLERIRGQMPGDGYLILGGAETVLGLTDAFAPAPGGRGLYVAAGGAATPVRAFG